jgi:hypothetical protein
LVVPVCINGRGPWDFVVDTGTNQTVVDPGLWTELGLATSSAVTLNTLAGPQRAMLSVVDQMSVGSSSVKKLEILIGSVETIRAVDRSIRGILGLDFLYHFAFALDYEPARLRLFPPDLLADPENSGGGSVDIQLTGGRLLIPSTWQDATERLLALDSGIGSVLLFVHRAAVESGPRAGELRRHLTTNAASTETFRIPLPDFAVGQHQIRRSQGLLLPRVGETSELREDGLLPASLFRSVFVNAHARIAAFKDK